MRECLWKEAGTRDWVYTEHSSCSGPGLAARQGALPTSGLTSVLPSLALSRCLSLCLTHTLAVTHAHILTICSFALQHTLLHTHSHTHICAGERWSLQPRRRSVMLRMSCVGHHRETLQKYLGKTKGFLVNPVFFPSPTPSVTNGPSPPRFLKSCGAPRFYHTGVGSRLCELPGVSAPSSPTCTHSSPAVETPLTPPVETTIAVCCLVVRFFPDQGIWYGFLLLS